MAVTLGRFTVHSGGKNKKTGEDKHSALRTGCSVESSGIYRVHHAQHSLPREVTLIAGEPFPRCSRCADPVYFELLRSTPNIGNQKRFRIALYELPELAEQDEALAG